MFQIQLANICFLYRYQLEGGTATKLGYVRIHFEVKDETTHGSAIESHGRKLPMETGLCCNRFLIT
jgi:hypothetical protein